MPHQPDDAPAEYDDRLIAFLETVWGDGFLSPGGPEEVDLVLAGVALAGLRVLDFGCGTGGIACHLVAAHGAAHVTGIDVEAPVLAHARHRAQRRGLAARTAFVKVEPGPLPFSDATFDAVFSKDAMIHVPDKEALFADLFRVLRPGGVIAASDWLSGGDGPPSPEMAAYVEQEGLSFGMASPRRSAAALEAAGFAEIDVVDRNPWYRDLARAELARLEGPLYEAASAAAGRAVVDKNIETWRRMIVVLNAGELRPTHLRARKPKGAPA
jgi:ubiquinone/menaquinone biosynthesis C-methylase UbiE